MSVIADALLVQPQAACPWFDGFIGGKQVFQTKPQLNMRTAPFTFKATEGREHSSVFLEAADVLI